MGTEGKNDAGHERDLQNARVAEYPLRTAIAHLRTALSVESEQWSDGLCVQAMLTAFDDAATALWRNAAAVDAEPLLVDKHWDDLLANTVDAGLPGGVAYISRKQLADAMADAALLAITSVADAGARMQQQSEVQMTPGCGYECHFASPRERAQGQSELQLLLHGDNWAELADSFQQAKLLLPMDKPEQAEVPMEDERPLDANVERLIGDYPAHGTALALAQSLKAMGDVRAADGAEGHAVICRRAARFVRVMAMQVTRFLAQPDLRLTHPAHEVDLQVNACTVNDGGDVQVMCTGGDQLPAPIFPLHELVTAGPVSDISRVMAQVMGRAVVQDAIGQLMKDGRMPGLDELTARHGLDMGQLTPGEVTVAPYSIEDEHNFSGVSVRFEPPPGYEAFGVPSNEAAYVRDCEYPERMPAAYDISGVPSDSAWQPAEQLAEEPQSVTTHNLSAHAGYVMKDGRTVPDTDGTHLQLGPRSVRDDLPLDGQ